MSDNVDQRHNLPAHLPTLIGREEAILTIRRLVLKGESGLVTLTGTGGTGKTRLALAVAHGLTGDFADGVWLVELAPLSDSELLPGAVAASLGIKEQPGRPAREVLLDELRARAVLLVSDNCEHMVEGCAALAVELMHACPGLRILATSREPLGLPGELTWRVPTLPTPDPQELPTQAEVGAYPAVRLFLERAQAVQPRFALSAQNWQGGTHSEPLPRAHLSSAGNHLSHVVVAEFDVVRRSAWLIPVAALLDGLLRRGRHMCPTGWSATRN